jgi:predicted RNA binding protein YcfA (HicA-like mRNA interferase family)
VPKLQPVSYRDFISKLKRLGFTGPFGGGKHQFMIRSDIRLTIPNPHKKEIGIDLLTRILRQAGVSREEWLNVD